MGIFIYKARDTLALFCPTRLNQSVLVESGRCQSARVSTLPTEIWVSWRQLVSVGGSRKFPSNIEKLAPIIGLSLVESELPVYPPHLGNRLFLVGEATANWGRMQSRDCPYTPVKMAGARTWTTATYALTNSIVSLWEERRVPTEIRTSRHHLLLRWRRTQGGTQHERLCRRQRLRDSRITAATAAATAAVRLSARKTV